MDVGSDSVDYYEVGGFLAGDQSGIWLAIFFGYRSQLIKVGK